MHNINDDDLRQFKVLKAKILSDETKMNKFLDKMCSDCGCYDEEECEMCIFRSYLRKENRK